MNLALILLLLMQVAPKPDRVVVEPAEIAVGESHQLEATAYDADGNKLADVTVRWFSTNRTALSIDRMGVATAHAPGTVRVAAVVDGVPGYGEVTIPQLPPAAITASVPVAALLAGTDAPVHLDVRTRLGDALGDAAVTFTSRDPAVATVEDRRVVGHRPGTTTIRAAAGPASAEVAVRVVENPATAYEVVPALTETVRAGDVVRFRVRAVDAGGAEVAGLHPAWTVGQPGAQIEAEGGEGVFVAEQPGTYRVAALVGPEIVRTATVEVEPRRYNARLVKMGRGGIGHHHSGDTWVFEGVDGRDYAYIGTFMHDWMKVWDVTNPEMTVLTDSIQVDARRINDVKIHPNNRLGLITREGASNRKNGIVLLDLSDPAHPTILSEYTDSVTGGVHNVWIDGERDLVYACHNGTSELHIIDISDPRNPREVGRWGLDKEDKTLHDVIVQEGYAYLSYWDDGLIILDVGAGTHGGTPTEPAFVSQYKYPEGNTHVAWRHGRYVFVGDEIFPDDWQADAPIEARGFIHVLDVTDIDHPEEVARYEVPEAGAHNVWAEGDRLYVGYYQGGLRVLDISGELRGDLYRQGREMAVLKTTDEITTVPNWPMTWGAQVFKGNIFTSDLNSGLWIAKLIEDALVP